MKFLTNHKRKKPVPLLYSFGTKLRGFYNEILFKVHRVPKGTCLFKNLSVYHCRNLAEKTWVRFTAILMQLPWVYLSVWMLIHHKNHSAQNQITNPNEDSTYVANCAIIINLVRKSFRVNRGRDSFRNAGIFL